MIRFERTSSLGTLPARATEYSAGYDAFACLLDPDPQFPDDAVVPRKIQMRNAGNVVTEFMVRNTPINPDQWSIPIPAGFRALIPIGFRASLPPDCECQVRPRSGLAWKNDITVANAPGTIDADYPLEWMVILVNRSSVAFEVAHNARIAQLVVAPRYEQEWIEGIVTLTTERTAGLGSTGV